MYAILRIAMHIVSLPWEECSYQKSFMSIVCIFISHKYCLYFYIVISLYLSLTRGRLKNGELET